MTIELVTCSHCDGEMTSVDFIPVLGKVPTICGGCREELSRQVNEAKQVFYGEEK